MTLLLSPEALARRRDAVRGPLAPLERSLRDDLQPLIGQGFEIPTAKALLSRDGGRCPRHGTALEFDPYRPHEHRCPVCGESFRGERHDRWWVMWYQLWLAERAVHAAALHALTGERELADLTVRIISGYAENYLSYPNRDNVLGPSRPFFSTYLESIWLLQLCVSVDLLEMSGAGGTLGGVARDRIIQPSAALISSFDEGASNRQVWNDAALLAASLLLGDDAGANRAVAGRSGLLSHLSQGLLVDGTWYEGENYHFFAHRGLWYGVTMAEGWGAYISTALRERFQEAFAAPLATALPDFTFPSRRDSQYGISLRQWRFAESCELGLARADDERLRGALHELYVAGAAPSRDTGRWRSTAEAERNEPAAALSRSDLGWRSLLLARDSLGVLEPQPRRSALLRGQGIAVLRRASGESYLALDYGHSGGGHGHPDRLNVLLMRGSERWLDDMGTGSYVDPSLHWYRSTLAHNAPLVNGMSQRRSDGVLLAFDEREDVGWVDAEVPWGGIAPGVRVRRSLVAMDDYAVDRIEWESSGEIRFELPLHITAALHGVGAWTAAILDGGGGEAVERAMDGAGTKAASEDGFAFVRDSSMAAADALAVVRLDHDDGPVAWALASGPSEWWRARAPGAPGSGEREFLVLRMRGTAGTMLIVWNWGAAVARVSALDQGLEVHRVDGSRHEHQPRGTTWRVNRVFKDSQDLVELGAGVATGAIARSGAATPVPVSGVAMSLSRAQLGDSSADVRRPAVSPPERLVEPSPDALPLGPGQSIVFDLARSAYRVSEESWDEAGCPRAVVTLSMSEGEFVMEVDVKKSPVFFRSADAPDPALDNEQADIHSDGVQLYVAAPSWSSPAGWLAVPEPGGTLRTRLVGGAHADVPLESRWWPTPEGYSVRFAIPLPAIVDEDECEVGVEVVVNNMTAERTRRRGQLVLSGGAGEHVYLRGDREDPARFRRFRLVRV